MDNESKKAYDRAYHNAHKEKRNEQSRTYYHENNEKCRKVKNEYSKNRWKNMTPEEREEYNAKRRAMYANDKEYREKAKARAREYGKTEAGKESNRKSSLKAYYKNTIGDCGDRYFS